MKHVNGDMEDLFRRAAEKYPLRTDSADWGRLAAALDKDPGPPSDADSDDKRRRRGFFWWWLLLPLAVGLGIYSWRATVHPSAHLSKPAHITAAATTSTGKAGASGGDLQRVGTSGGDPQRVETQRAGTQPEGASAGDVQRVETPDGGRSGGISPGRSATPAGEMRPTGSGRTRSAGASRERIRPMGSGGTRLTGASAERTRSTGPDAKAGGISGGSGPAGSAGKQGGYENSAAGKAVAARLDLQRAQTAGSFSVVVDVKAPPARKDSSAKQAKKATVKSNGGHGYIGLTGAPDFSTVKMQSMKGVGTTWGLLLGYAFNSHWAVESGVYLDRKKYYSAGEYFYTKNPLPYPLKSVNGSCNMWEIPLNVRYNFNPGSKITWFATAGASSYFMTKQQYTYQYESGGYTWPTNWSTSVPVNYLFSIINLSGGFEQRIGRIGNLRIEPYLRIPLSGIGTGNLPIMSAGLNIGITHQLW